MSRLSYLPQTLLLLFTLGLWISNGASSARSNQEYEYRSVQLPVSQFYDNVATEDFDRNRAGYAVEHLPTGELLDENIKFALPKWGNSRPDNFISNDQVLDVDAGLIREFHILYAGDWIDGETVAQFEFEFEDTNKQVIELSVKNWWNLHWLNSGAVKTPFHNTPEGPNRNETQLHHWSSTVSSRSPLKKIRFPSITDRNRLHVFAITLVPAYAVADEEAISPPAISVKNVRLTSLKNDQGDSVVQVTLANLRASAVPGYRFTSPHGVASLAAGHRDPRPPVRRNEQQVLSSDQTDPITREYEHYAASVLSGPHEVIIRATNGHGIRTTSPGKVYRIMLGDDVRVDVGVIFEQDSEGLASWLNSAVEAVGLGKETMVTSDLVQRELQIEVLLVSTVTNSPVVKSTGWDLDLAYSGVSGNGGDSWEATRESLGRHETPRWWNNAKFGIFIHWGVFSVPGWAPKGPYAEWYDWSYRFADPNNGFWTHHRDTYGIDKAYDDFIPEFTASKFDAAEWVDLFATAGAKYFVLVTKHHDGFALFDTHDSTHRSSVHLGPKRDLIGELMKASRERHPTMRKGTYYSMPEWFNPDAVPYGFGDWPGGLPRNPYYEEAKYEPYTGRLEGKDYLKDIQLEHMRILMDEYETEIMWCDIGGPNRTLEFAAEWYNKAAKAGREVTLNNRCGVVPDFDTPEYTRFSSIQTHSWETSEGIDPYSYGYNRATKPEEYRSAETIIHTLVDIVSKNGNYLLNLGPTGEGEIIPAMVERLVEVGKWLEHSGSCVYDTTYSFLGAQTGTLRFTTTPTSFCIIALSAPSDNMLIVDRPVPILPGDTITLLGAESIGPLSWSYRNGQLAVIVPDEGLRVVQHAWAFKVIYNNAA